MLNVQLKRKRTFAQSVLFVVFLLSSTLAFAQNKVTGTVTDKSGEPLAGVNVLEKGTTNGCITDLDGKYDFGQTGFLYTERRRVRHYTVACNSAY